jgi:murein endopeptidase
VGWRRDELWFEVDVEWFGDRLGAPAVAGLELPPLPRFGPYGLSASRHRRDAWKRRRRARASALMLLPAVLAPPAVLKSGGAGASVLPEDPPSLTVRVKAPARDATLTHRPETVQRPDPASAIRWRNATSVGLWWNGGLRAGTQLPVEGPDWVTWNPISDRVPNLPRRLYGNERTIRTLLSVVESYRQANPGAPRVVVGDISFESGGPMDAHVSHQNGLDVDVYYPRRDGALRAPRSVEAVDRRLAQDLLDRFVEAGGQMVFVGYSTGLRGPSGVVVPYPNHENHMHVRFSAHSDASR